jgi:hypothetical protein
LLQGKLRQFPHLETLLVAFDEFKDGYGEEEEHELQQLLAGAGIRCRLQFCARDQLGFSAPPPFQMRWP